jgi:hypothetical protein
MELWQWITLEDTQVQTWLGQADIPELIVPKAQAPFVQSLVQIGACLQASCLVFPLVWGVPSNQVLEMKQSLVYCKKIEISPHWLFQIAFHKDDGGSENIINTQVSALKVTSVFGEFITCFTEIIEQLGWNFLSFSKSANSGFFSLLLAKPEAKTVADLSRGLVLMRAAMEILSYSRGFQLASFELCLSSQDLLAIDHNLIKKITEG